LNLPLSVVAMGLGLAAAFAVVSALLPALRAQRLSIVDALAGR
jgi:ABC-type antimicrobial peptide transport system permease subunit